MKKSILILIAIIIIAAVVTGIFVIKPEPDEEPKEIVPENQIQIKYISAKPGFGYYDVYIINNSGKYIDAFTGGIWTAKLGYPEVKPWGEINYEELQALYQEIEDKGFFELENEYLPTEPMTGGSTTWISISKDGEFKEVKNSYGAPDEFYNIVDLIVSQYPPKRDCSLRRQEDFPDTLDILTRSVCSEYYIRYYDKCTCI